MLLLAALHGSAYHGQCTHRGSAHTSSPSCPEPGCLEPIQAAAAQEVYEMCFGREPIFLPIAQNFL